MRDYLSFTLSAAFASFFLMRGPCVAQSPAPDFAGAQNVAPDQKPPADKADKTEPLSKTLKKNEGVLEPPAGVDPHIHKDPPAETGDRMPVIVPPGEPGGDQSIQPK